MSLASSNDLHFRAATPADAAAVVALVESAYRGDASRQGWTTEADLLEGRRTDEADVLALIAKPYSEIVLAQRDGELLASAHIELHDENACYFGMFSVRPSLQGGGVGKLLLAECEGIARDRWQCRIMDMTVIRQRTDLIPWYERRGYRLTGARKPFPYGDLNFGVPKRDDLEFLIMAKELS